MNIFFTLIMLITQNGVQTLNITQMVLCDKLSAQFVICKMDLNKSLNVYCILKGSQWNVLIL